MASRAICAACKICCVLGVTGFGIIAAAISFTAAANGSFECRWTRRLSSTFAPTRSISSETLISGVVSIIRNVVLERPRPLSQRKQASALLDTILCRCHLNVMSTMLKHARAYRLVSWGLVASITALLAGCGQRSAVGHQIPFGQGGGSAGYRT